MTQRSKDMDAKMDALLEDSPLVFLGRLEQTKAPTPPPGSPAGTVGVVQVTEEFGFPAHLRYLRGRSILLAFKGKPPAATASSLFFAHAWHFSDRVGLAEKGRIQGVKDVEALRKALLDARQRQADRALSQRLLRTSIVASGRVVEVHDSSVLPKVSPSMDPCWRTAVVAVDSVIRGKVRAGHVSVHFPSREHGPWHRAPKFRVGQQAIWLLRPSQQEDSLSPRFRIPGLTALRPMDVQAPETLERIRWLAHGGR